MMILYTFGSFSRFDEEPKAPSGHQIPLESYSHTFKDIVTLLENDGAQFDKQTIFYYHPVLKVYLLLTPETDLPEHFQNSKELKLRLRPVCSEECELRFKAMEEKMRLLETKLIWQSQPDFKQQISCTSQLDIGIVYANPLKKSPQSDFLSELALDYESECRKIAKSFESMNKNITTQIALATRSSLLDIVQKGPKILQILCHVVHDKEKDDYSLAFENGKGALDSISITELIGILKNQKANIDLVIINLSYSNAIAQALHDIGIADVICVKSESYFQEQTSQEFFQLFYKYIFDGMSVESAFDKTREVLDQADLYCCSPELKHKELANLSVKSDQVDQFIILKAKAGTPEIAADDNFLNRNFSVSRTIGRDSELLQLYTLLSASDVRAVVLLGNLGSGKSAFVRELACYLNIRGYFREGVCLIDMEGIKTPSQFVSELSLKLLDPGEISKTDGLSDNLLEPMKTNRTLVILEDCDNFILQHEQNFVGILTSIIQDTAHLKFLLTASKKIDLQLNEATIELPNLSGDKALNILTEIVPSEYLPSNPKKELEDYSQTFGLQTVFWISQLLQTRVPLHQIITQLKTSGINSERNPGQEISPSALEANFERLKEINAEEYHLFGLMSLYPTGLNTKDLTAHAGAGLVTIKWRQYLLASDVYSQLDSRMKMYTSSQLGIPTHLVVDSRAVEGSGESRNYIITPPIQSYFKQYLLTAPGLRLFRNKLYFLSAIAVNLLRQVRYSNIYSERLAEYSLISTYDYWQTPDILITTWNLLRRRFPFSFQNPVPKLTELRRAFELYKSNLISIFSEEDQEALKHLLKEGPERNEIFNMIQILWLGIPTLYKIFFGAFAEEITETALISLAGLNLSKQEFLVFKAKLLLCLFGIYNHQSNKNLQKLVGVLKGLQELRKAIKGSPKLEGLEAELFFVEAYFIYRLKKKKYGASEDLPIPEEERRYTWALKLLGQALELLGEEERFQLLIGRISLLQCKIYTSVKEKENIPLLSLEKKLKTAIESFEKQSNLKRLELKTYWLLARLYQKGLKERVNLKNLNLSTQQAYQQLNEIKKNLLRKDVINFLKDFGDKDYESKIKGLVKEINQNFLENFTNVVAFLKAAPIENSINSTEIPTFFKSDLLSSVRDLKRNARFKFEVLTKDSALKTMNFGCRILYIDAEIVPQKGLAVERSDHSGGHEIISYEELGELLSTTPLFLKSQNISQLSMVTHSSLDPEANRLMIVMLKHAPDESLRGIILNRLMIPYLVWFDFTVFQQHSQSRGKPENRIEDEYHRKLLEETYREKFASSFVEQLVSGHFVDKAFDEAKAETKEFLWKSFHFEATEYVRLETPKITTTKNKIMFAELASQFSIEDISVPRCPTNISKIFLPFTGRRREMKEIFEALRESTGNYVKVIGGDGCGKTRLVLEAGYYLMLRNQYPDGVFYFTCSRQSSESLVTKIRKTFSPSPLELRKLDKIFASKKMLVILDDFDEREGGAILQQLLQWKIHVITVATVDEQQILKWEKVREKPKKQVSIELLSEQEMYDIIKSYTGFVPQQLFPEINALKLIRETWMKPKYLLSALLSQGYLSSSGAVYRIKEVYSSYLNFNEWLASRSSDRGSRHEEDLNVSRNSRFYQKSVKRTAKERDESLVERTRMTVTQFLENLGVETVEEEIVNMSDFDDQSDEQSPGNPEAIEFNSDLEENENFGPEDALDADKDFLNEEALDAKERVVSEEVFEADADFLSD